MKFVVLMVCILFTSHSLAASQRFAYAKTWLTSWVPESIDLNMASSGVRFKGCRQKEYQLKFIQPISDNFSIESAVSYANAKLSWGVFSQKISLRKFSVVPRYHVTHNLSVGFGLVSQSAIEFKNVLGSQFDLPQNIEWLVSTRMGGLSRDQQWELSVSQQKWDSHNTSGTWFETGETDSKISLAYIAYF